MDDKLLSRVRALLTQAENTTFPEEAKTFTERAHELMARHGIEQAQLADAGVIKDEIISARVDMTGSYTSSKTTLLSSIALACRCRTVRYSADGSSVVAYVVIIGHASDIERVEILYTSLLLQASGQVTRQRPPVNFWGEPTASVVTYRRSWFTGFAHEVRHRLEVIEARAAAAAQATQTASGASGTSTELVLIDRKTAVNKAYDELFPDLPKVKNRSAVHPDAYYAGKAAGQRADLGQTRVGDTSRRALR